jgi:hypothetical protein
MWEQLKPFNQSTATSIKNLCLGNVQRGFQVGAKYATAWQAWENTQQHTDPIPNGVDVPVFFSYTASIDGINKNWGHIGVRLKDGTFWSDGVIYPSISAYTANHLPKYVGWGESVNDVRVIKQGVQMTDEAKKEIYRVALHREPENDTVWRGVSTNPEAALKNARGSQEWLTQNHVLKVAYPESQQKIKDLTKQVTDLKAQVGSTDEANILGKALLPIIKALGYKK